MKWFGPSWNAPINENVERMGVPTGKTCLICGNKFDKQSQGIAVPYLSENNKLKDIYYDLSCWMKEIAFIEGVELRPNVIISNSDHLSEL